MSLLHRLRTQEIESRRTARHHVRVVSVNAQRLTRHRTSRHVEHARKHLASNLVHVGNHKKQSLRARERRAQAAAHQSAVNSARGTSFRLHLHNRTIHYTHSLHLPNLTKHILHTTTRVRIHIRCHGGGRSDRVNEAVITELIARAHFIIQPPTRCTTPHRYQSLSETCNALQASFYIITLRKDLSYSSIWIIVKPKPNASDFAYSDRRVDYQGNTTVK